MSKICPTCGRKRPDDLALFIPCPGPYDRARGVSLGGCGDESLMEEKHRTRESSKAHPNYYKWLEAEKAKKKKVYDL